MDLYTKKLELSRKYAHLSRDDLLWLIALKTTKKANMDYGGIFAGNYPILSSIVEPMNLPDFMAFAEAYPKIKENEGWYNKVLRQKIANIVSKGVFEYLFENWIPLREEDEDISFEEFYERYTTDTDFQTEYAPAVTHFVFASPEQMQNAVKDQNGWPGYVVFDENNNYVSAYPLDEELEVVEEELEPGQRYVNIVDANEKDLYKIYHTYLTDADFFKDTLDAFMERLQEGMTGEETGDIFPHEYFM